MNCPKCQLMRLKQEYVHGVNLNVDYCPKCKGVWFDRGELEQAMPVADPQMRIPHNAVRLEALCPGCAKPIYAFPYPGTRVMIEMCKSCEGLWLDSGEFKQIRVAREQYRPPETPAQDEPVPGVKGTLIRLIDGAIAELWHGLF